MTPAPDRYPLPPYPDTGFQVAGVSLFGCVLNAPTWEDTMAEDYRTPIVCGEMLISSSQPSGSASHEVWVWKPRLTHAGPSGPVAVRQLAQGHSTEGTVSLLGSTMSCGRWGMVPSLQRLRRDQSQ